MKKKYLRPYVKAVRMVPQYFITVSGGSEEQNRNVQNAAPFSGDEPTMPTGPSASRQFDWDL